MDGSAGNLWEGKVNFDLAKLGVGCVLCSGELIIIVCCEYGLNDSERRLEYK